MTTRIDPSGNGHAPASWLTNLRPSLSGGQRDRFQAYLAEIFGALGMNLGTPGTAETPRRHLQALVDATAGYDGDPKLVTVFSTSIGGLAVGGGGL